VAKPDGVGGVSGGVAASPARPCCFHPAKTGQVARAACNDAKPREINIVAPADFRIGWTHCHRIMTRCTVNSSRLEAIPTRSAKWVATSMAVQSVPSLRKCRIRFLLVFSW
jgi:hypothetical protein